MAILSRPKISPQQRFDLEDFLVLLSGICADSKNMIAQFWAPGQYVLKGFTVSGVGAPSPVSVNITAGTLINANSTGDFSYFVSDTSTPISVALQANSRNYLELSLSTSDGTPLPRAFWDPSADSGQGSEFQQTVNTLTSIDVGVVALTGGFSGSSNRIPLAIVDTNISNTVKNIIDKRPMLFRLGQPGNPLNSFAWATRTEPEVTITLSGVSGTFTAGETLNFAGGATALCTLGGSTPIKANTFSSDSFGASVTGASSGATGTLVTMQEAFNGADKDIDNLKEMLDAFMTEIKGLKGTNFWFEGGYGSIYGSMKFLNSMLTQNSSTAYIGWDGANVKISDTAGSPSSADVLGLIRIFGYSGTLSMRRQDGTGGSTLLPLSDGEVLFVQLPASGNRAYSVAGSGSTNYQKVARASFVLNDTNYWLAYREGGKLYVRGIGELEAGEEGQIGDSVPQDLLTALGLTETDPTPNYSSDVRGAPGESFLDRIGTLTANEGDEQEDRTMYFKSDSPIVWTGTQLIWTSPLVLQVLNAKAGASYSNTISTSFSPLSIGAGESIYFSMTRGNAAIGTLTNSGITPIPAQSQAQKDLMILARREDVSSGTYGEESDVTTQQLLYIPLHKQVIRNGASTYLGESGRGRGVIRVDYHDPISTTLPTGAAVTIDGVSGVNGDLVLFSNLGVNNNRIFKLAGVGTAITWTAQYDYFTGLDPLDGEMAIVEKGNGFADQIGRFTGTFWNFNKTVRYFTGADYVEMGAINTVAITNNTTANVFTVTALGSENWVVHYSLTRGLTKENGTIYVTTDGATVSVTKIGPFLGSTGVSFSGDINLGNIRLRYTSDNSGSAGVMKLFTFRWSDASGGPGGIPNYSGGGGATVIAAGSPGDIQFKDVGGGLAADSRFKVDAVKGVITLGSLELLALNGPVTLADNQGSFQTIFSYNAATYKRAIIEYSITRNGEERTGRILVATNGAVAGQSDDFVETTQVQPTGIVLQAIFSAGNILIQYTSDSQGVSGQFNYSMRRW